MVKGKKKRIVTIEEVLVCRLKSISLGSYWTIERFFHVMINGQHEFSSVQSLPRLAREIVNLIKISRRDSMVFADKIKIKRLGCKESYVSYLDGYFGRPLVPASVNLMLDLTDKQYGVFKRSFERNLAKSREDKNGGK